MISVAFIRNISISVYKGSWATTGLAIPVVSGLVKAVQKGTPQYFVVNASFSTCNTDVFCVSFCVSFNYPLYLYSYFIPLLSISVIYFIIEWRGKHCARKHSIWLLFNCFKCRHSVFLWDVYCYECSIQICKSTAMTDRYFWKNWRGIKK